MADMTLWGFDGSTYVRTVKMVLAEKGVTDFKQVPLNVLAGDPKTPEHRERHPFGKVPVLDHDGVRILETTAIARYLNDVLPGKSLIPSAPKDRARMDMIIGLIDSYGYGALTGGVAAYHLFPDFVGGKNEAMRKGGLENGRKVIELAMKTKGSSPFIAGDLSLCRPVSRPDCLLRFADAGQGCGFQRPRLCRLVDKDPSLAKFQRHTAESRLTTRLRRRCSRRRRDHRPRACSP